MINPSLLDTCTKWPEESNYAILINFYWLLEEITKAGTDVYIWIRSTTIDGLIDSMIRHGRGNLSYGTNNNSIDGLIVDWITASKHYAPKSIDSITEDSFAEVLCEIHKVADADQATRFAFVIESKQEENIERQTIDKPEEEETTAQSTGLERENN